MKDRAFLNWLIILLGVVAIMGLCFTPAFADDLEIQDESFGENYQYTWIPCRSFTPYSSSTGYSNGGHNYRYFTSTTDPYLDAAINLPSGASLQAARLYYYDAHEGHVTMWIYREWPADAFEVLGSYTTDTASGWGQGVVTLNHTIRNRDNMYTVRAGASAATPTLGFMGVRLYWKRQISPAPATATFNDVGPSHWAFQSVEALAASGITKGCPDGPNLFCPDKPVSRAAMAAFLARALGLHWDAAQGW